MEQSTRIGGLSNRKFIFTCVREKKFNS